MENDKDYEPGLSAYNRHRQLLDDEIRRAGGKDKFYRRDCGRKKAFTLSNPSPAKRE